MTFCIGRRDFITLLGSAAVAWPLAGRAQQPEIPVVGFLNGGSPDGYAPMVAAFHQGLMDTGYVEAQSVRIEHRWADGQYDRLPAMAADLVHRQVAVIVTNSPGMLAAKAATTTIPIVFTTSGDPVELGFVASLARPGRNITGVTQLAPAHRAAAMERARQLAPVLVELKSIGMSVRRMAVELMLRGVQTPNGAKWHAQTVRRMIDRAEC